MKMHSEVKYMIKQMVINERVSVISVVEVLSVAYLTEVVTCCVHHESVMWPR